MSSRSVTTDGLAVVLQPISALSHGENQARRVRIALELGAELPDVRVHRARDHVGVVAPYFLEQLEA